MDRQVQIHCIYPHSQSDAIQLNASDYDPDIDGEPDSVTDIQLSNAEPIREDNSTDTSKSEHPSDYHPQLEDIPELETDEENWDDGQFDDAELLNNHNSTEESNRIHCEYSAHFQKVEDQQYSPYQMAQGVEYHIPEPDYYHNNAQPKQYWRQQNQKVYLPSPPSIEDIHTWYGRGRGWARCLELHGHRLYGERPGHWKADWCENIRKINACKNVELLIPNLHSLFHT